MDGIFLLFVSLRFRKLFEIGEPLLFRLVLDRDFLLEQSLFDGIQITGVVIPEFDRSNAGNGAGGKHCAGTGDCRSRRSFRQKTDFPAVVFQFRSDAVDRDGGDPSAVVGDLNKRRSVLPDSDRIAGGVFKFNGSPGWGGNGAQFCIAVNELPSFKFVFAGESPVAGAGFPVGVPIRERSEKAFSLHGVLKDFKSFLFRFLLFKKAYFFSPRSLPGDAVFFRHSRAFELRNAPCETQNPRFL